MASSNEKPAGVGKEVFETGLKNLQNFFKGKVPGKIRLSSRWSAMDHDAIDAAADSPSGRTSFNATSSEAAARWQASEDTSTPSRRSSLPDSVGYSRHESIRDGQPLERTFAAMDVSGNRGPDEASTSGSSGLGMGTAASAPTLFRNARISAAKLAKLEKLLDQEPVIDLDALREMAWSGLPAELRPVCWRLLLGYLPPNRSRQAAALARKRREYAELVPQFYDISNAERSEDEVTSLRQVAVDVPRTAPNVPAFHQPALQKSLERMLYIWGIRHPASGYVQGMNDLVTPFLAVFLSEALHGPLDSWEVGSLPEATLLDIEADCYWCLCRLLEGIQDHYTYAQPGIQRTVFKMRELIRLIDPPFSAHLESQSVDLIQFAFRWVNCLLVRELPFCCAVRLWDTYLAEGAAGFADFLVYVAVALLLHYRDQLIGMDFQDVILFVQRLPTGEWEDEQMEVILSKAYMWRDKYGDAGH